MALPPRVTASKRNGTAINPNDTYNPPAIAPRKLRASRAKSHLSTPIPVKALQVPGKASQVQVKASQVPSINTPAYTPAGSSNSTRTPRIECPDSQLIRASAKTPICFDTAPTPRPPPPSKRPASPVSRASSPARSVGGLSAAGRAQAKEKIPATVRNAVWNLHISNTSTNGFCCCCKREPITKANFAAGHVQAEACGGEVKLQNLRPICNLCNSSMGKMDMDEFMAKYGFDALETPRSVTEAFITGIASKCSVL
jgi:hypothetical protein